MTASTVSSNVLLLFVLVVGMTSATMAIPSSLLEQEYQRELAKASNEMEWTAAMTGLLKEKEGTSSTSKWASLTNGGRLPGEPTTVSDDAVPTPTKLCDACRTISGTVFDALLHDKNTTFHLLEWAVELVCAEAFQSSQGEKLCQNIADLLLYGLHKADLEVQGKLKFNMSIIMCTDVLPVCKVPCCITEDTPEQVHIGFPTGGDAVTTGQMQVTWATYTKPTLPTVQWWMSNGSGFNESVAHVNTTTYTKSGWVGWLHGAVMTDLLPGTTYIYRIGTLGVDGTPNQGPSSFTSEFTTLPLDIGTPERPLKVVSFADMGTGGTHDQTVNSLLALVQQGEIDIIIHGGDISYADGDQYRWDRFLREMQPIVSRVPYMLIPGNHELLYNFTAYRTRFFMQPTPGYGAPDDAMFYSFTVGPNIRFMMMDSESPEDTPLIRTVQTNWAERVLQEASASKQFIFTAFHRPLYCTSTMSSCFNEQTYIQGRVEEMLIENNVAIVHTGHVHNYERTYPVAHGVRQSTSYENTTAPVSFVNGAPGCEEGFAGFGNYHNKARPDYSAKRIEKTSFQFTEIHSESLASPSTWKHTAFIRQFASEDMSMIDNITMTKYF